LPQGARQESKWAIKKNTGWLKKRDISTTRNPSKVPRRAWSRFRLRAPPCQLWGSTGEMGLHQLVWERLGPDNSVDEEWPATRDEVNVTVHADKFRHGESTTAAAFSR